MSCPDRRAYRAQKSSAKRRGIEFEFSFDEWMEWWGDDYHLRGNKYGQLAMCRFMDKGPYAPDNCYKGTNSANASYARERERESRINTSPK